LKYGVLYTAKRGEVIKSYKEWSNLFNWERGKVRAFFELLEKEQMITINSDTRTTILKVCNYDKYQFTKPTENPQETNEEPTETQPKTNEEPTNNQPKANIKKEGKELKTSNEKKLRKSKKETPLAPSKLQFLDSVFLFQNEYEKLIEQFGEPDTKRMIEKLNWWKLDKETPEKQSKGSDFAKINRWVAKAVEEEKTKAQNGLNRNAGAGGAVNEKPAEKVKDYSTTSFSEL
jgi:hypothetical protein